MYRERERERERERAGEMERERGRDGEGESAQQCYLAMLLIQWPSATPPPCPCDFVVVSVLIRVGPDDTHACHSLTFLNRVASCRPCRHSCLPFAYSSESGSFMSASYASYGGVPIVAHYNVCTVPGIFVCKTRFGTIRA